MLCLRGGDGGGPHQVVDVDAIGEVGRYPPGGGVGMVEVSFFLEIAHRVADRGRRQAELVPFRDRPAPRRFGGLHVRLDHGLENLALSVRKRCRHRCVSGCIVNSATIESNRNHPSGVHLSLPSAWLVHPWAAKRGGGEGRRGEAAASGK